MDVDGHVVDVEECPRRVERVVLVEVRVARAVVVGRMFARILGMADMTPAEAAPAGLLTELTRVDRCYTLISSKESFSRTKLISLIT